MTMSFFSTDLAVDHARVTTAIVAAERRTSGEIRVLVVRGNAEDPVAVARKHFERLEMHRTKARNAVLILVAPRSRTFAVVGDVGVHEKCGDAFWSELAAAMTEHFKRGDFTGGLVVGIERAGALLEEFFPRAADDRNELPDQVEEAE